jgi:DNA-binding MarR family transcriptional regulator
MSEQHELTPKQASILAAIAQTPFAEMQDRFKALLEDDEVALEIADQIVSPTADASPAVRQTAQGIRLWAQEQRSSRRRSRNGRVLSRP